MTVTTTTSRVNYTGNGASIAYTITFPYLDPADLVVIVDGDTLIYGVDYTVVGDNTAPGSALNFTVAPADGSVITIRRVTPPTQLTEYTPYGEYKAEQIEQDLDKSAYLDQEQAGDLANKADVNHNHDDLYLRDAEIAADFAAINHTHGEYALASVQMLSGDPDIVTISNPSLTGDVTFTPKSNVPRGMAKLDDSGYIPLGLLPPSSNTFLGGYDASSNTLPPTPMDNGGYYIISVTGSLSVTLDGSPPSSELVDPNDKIVWDETISAWWLFRSVVGAVVAVGVIFNPAGDLSSVNVQDALEELDAEKAPTTHFNPSGLVPQMLYNGQVVAQGAPGGIEVIGGAGVEGVVGLTADGVNVADYELRNDAGWTILRQAAAARSQLISFGPGGADAESAFLYDHGDSAYMTFAGLNRVQSTAAGADILGTTLSVASAADIAVSARVLNAIGGAALQVRDTDGQMQIRQLNSAGDDEDVWISGERSGPVSFFSDSILRLRMATAAENAANNSGAFVTDAAGALRPVGHNVMYPITVSSGRDISPSDNAERLMTTTTMTLNLPNGALPVGGTVVVTVIAGTLTLTAATTLNWFAGGATLTGTRTISAGSAFTIHHRGGNAYDIWGNGIT